MNIKTLMRMSSYFLSTLPKKANGCAAPSAERNYQGANFHALAYNF